jgi:hypothetical protein
MFQGRCYYLREICLLLIFIAALCATSCGAFNTASKAFLKLEDDQSINEEDRKEYQKLAFQIFLRYVTKKNNTITIVALHISFFL